MSVALREVLTDPSFDEMVVQLFTFDEIVYEFDFGGDEVKCIAVDSSIKGDESMKILLPVLRECRV
jgi:hypothetical protein